MSVAQDRRSAQRIEESAARAPVRRDVQRLEAERERLLDDLGRAAAAVYRGEPADAVAEVEAELDGLDRELRRARAALTYLSD